MSGRTGPGSLPDAYQWRQSTLIMLKSAQIEWRERWRQTEKWRERLRNLGRQADGEVKSDERYTNYKSVSWKKKGKQKQDRDIC